MYRACIDYQEAVKRKDAAAMDTIYGTIVRFFVARGRDGDFLPAPDRQMTDPGYFSYTTDGITLLWVCRIMTEIKRRRDLRGRGTGPGSTQL
jgi:hypothetical protein